MLTILQIALTLLIEAAIIYTLITFFEKKRCNRNKNI